MSVSASVLSSTSVGAVVRSNCNASLPNLPWVSKTNGMTLGCGYRRHLSCSRLFAALYVGGGASVVAVSCDIGFVMLTSM